jgi:hypothetical protein
MVCSGSSLVQEGGWTNLSISKMGTARKTHLGRVGDIQTRVSAYCFACRGQKRGKRRGGTEERRESESERNVIVTGKCESRVENIACQGFKI